MTTMLKYKVLEKSYVHFPIPHLAMPGEIIEMPEDHEAAGNLELCPDQSVAITPMLGVDRQFHQA